MQTRQIDSPWAPVSVHEDGGLIHARGIPYAEARRFAPPEPISTPVGVVDATRRGPVCPQRPSRLEFVTGPVVDRLASSERCQVLSVTAPVDAAGLPVMVWFHGGAYVAGGGEAAGYDPDLLVGEGGVVVVTVTYRLGLLGYLNLHDPGTENLGLRDQLCALQWVRDNIAAFGGDPQRVTVFGQSAGGDSAMSLLLCPEAAGLFSRAILQSAPLGLRGSRTALTAAMREAATAALAGTPAAQASTEELLDAQAAAAAVGPRFGLLGLMPFAPLMNHAPLPPESDVDERLADAATRVEILVGYTRDDAMPFVVLSSRGARLWRLGPIGRAAVSVAARRATHRIFGRGAIDLARTWRAAGGRAVTFRVDWSPPGAPLGACHCIDLPLLFANPGVWSGAPMLGSDPDALYEGPGRAMRLSWSTFARDGAAGLPAGTLRIR
ncbi:carboxylesterase family protein [Mycobacterium sp. WMMD1722]|uniref:carboxylesterase family protein n=1 Tax=Mycobacterium sp. WMMD1722 TaxID=3404117 RepID=UPI003BF4FC11